MPKYQNILQSDKTLANDEFLAAAEKAAATLKGFKVLDARNLEGVREDIYAVPQSELDGWEKRHYKHLKGKAKYKVRLLSPAGSFAEQVDEIACPCGKTIVIRRDKRKKDALD